MITIMGATGHTGGAAADELLKQGEKIRVIGRSKDRLQALAARGAEIAVGDAADAAFLTSVFKGSDAVYVLIPPDMTSKDFPAHQDKVGEAIARAIKDSGVKHAVLLSSVGAELPSGTGPIAGLHRQEERLKKISGLNSLFLRAGYFFENQLGYLALVKQQGINGGAIDGNLPIPMIASADIGKAAGRALRTRDFKGATVHELLGQRDLTFNEATKIVGKAIERPDLKYVQFPYEAALDGMITMGLTKSIAEGFVEMSRGFNEKRIKSVEGRNPKNTTATRFEDFAAHVLAPAYKAM